MQGFAYANIDDIKILLAPSFHINADTLTKHTGFLSNNVDTLSNNADTLTNNVDTLTDNTDTSNIKVSTSSLISESVKGSPSSSVQSSRRSRNGLCFALTGSELSLLCLAFLLSLITYK